MVSWLGLVWGQRSSGHVTRLSVCRRVQVEHTISSCLLPSCQPRRFRSLTLLHFANKLPFCLHQYSNAYSVNLKLEATNLAKQRKGGASITKGSFQVQLLYLLPHQHTPGPANLSLGGGGERSVLFTTPRACEFLILEKQIVGQERHQGS